MRSCSVNIHSSRAVLAQGLGTSGPRQQLVLSETSHLGIEVGTSRAGLAGQARFFCAARGELGVSPGKEGEAR